MFKKSDHALTAQTLDPLLRAAAIIKLTRARTILHWTAVLASTVILVAAVDHQQISPSFLVVIILWTNASKTDSDLRLLRVIDLLQKDNKSLPCPD